MKKLTPKTVAARMHKLLSEQFEFDKSLQARRCELRDRCSHRCRQIGDLIGSNGMLYVCTACGGRFKWIPDGAEEVK